MAQHPGNTSHTPGANVGMPLVPTALNQKNKLRSSVDVGFGAIKATLPKPLPVPGTTR